MINKLKCSTFAFHATASRNVFINKKIQRIITILKKNFFNTHNF